VLTSRRAWTVFAVVAAVLYVTDQLSKRAAVDHLTGRADVSVVGDLLQLHLTRNPGAAFSLGTGFTVGLSCLAIVATVVVLGASRKVVDPVWAAGLGALLAGITGNLTDRMLREPGPFRGHVVDFLQLPNWPIFNVADIAINVGAGLILLQVFRGIRMDGVRPGRDEVDDPDHADNVDNVEDDE
jgi:signal peptidase II